MWMNEGTSCFDECVSGWQSVRETSACVESDECVFRQARVWLTIGADCACDECVWLIVRVTRACADCACDQCACVWRGRVTSGCLIDIQCVWRVCVVTCACCDECVLWRMHVLTSACCYECVLLRVCVVTSVCCDECVLWRVRVLCVSLDNSDCQLDAHSQHQSDTHMSKQRLSIWQNTRTRIYTCIHTYHFHCQSDMHLSKQRLSIWRNNNHLRKKTSRTDNQRCLFVWDDQKSSRDTKRHLWLGVCTHTPTRKHKARTHAHTYTHTHIHILSSPSLSPPPQSFSLSPLFFSTFSTNTPPFPQNKKVHRREKTSENP